MIRIDALVFNPFQVNTYVLHDESGECVIIDAGCHNDEERQVLDEYLRSRDLRPVKLLNTHCHIDHILGNGHVLNRYKLSTHCHMAENAFLEGMKGQGLMFGLECEPVPDPPIRLHDGEKILFGKSVLEVLHLPGHSAGSLAYLSREGQFVVVGDVLFNGSIGRTDLPGGDYQTLIGSIKNRLFPLGDEYVVYPGHGPSTTVSQERKYNPFLG